MSNNTSIFVPVGKNIFDLNSITNIEYFAGIIKVYVKNNSNGFIITESEYSQLINYYFSGKTITPSEIPRYVLVGKNMFNTTAITNVMYDNKAIVYIDNNSNGMTITDDEYDLLIKYLLAS